MRKLTSLFMVLGMVLYASSLIATEKTVEKVVIEKSPFSGAKFMMRSDNIRIYDPEKMGEIDAQNWDEPNTDLIVIFSEVVKEKNEPLRISDTLIKFEDVELLVDFHTKGMTLSYERESGAGRFEKIKIYMPTPTDLVIWLNTAANFYEKYTSAFWRKKNDLLLRDRTISAELEKKKRKLERLLEGPTLVYPEPVAH